MNYLSCYIGQVKSFVLFENQELSSCNACYYSAGLEIGVCIKSLTEGVNDLVGIHTDKHDKQYMIANRTVCKT